MLTIGITGGIGSGKSVVSKIFESLGVPVFDADFVTKKIMNEDAALKEQIQNAFGKEAYENGVLNRKYLANIVFNNEHQLATLNALVHPASIQAAIDWARKQTTPYVIKEAALLFEAGSSLGLDFIIGVQAPQALRIQRVIHRDGITREEVLARMDKQIDEQIKMKLCDFVIINDEQQLVLPQVIQLHQHFLQLTHSL
jgi:dephospho-CoA kinase